MLGAQPVAAMQLAVVALAAVSLPKSWELKGLQGCFEITVVKATLRGTVVKERPLSPTSSADLRSWSLERNH